MESPSMLLESMNRRLSVWYEWNRWDEAREVATSILQTSEQYQQDTGWQLRALTILAELAYRTVQQEGSEKLLRQHKRRFEQSSSKPLLLPPIPAALEDNRGLAKLFYEQALGFFESLHAVPAAQRVREALARDTPAAV